MAKIVIPGFLAAFLLCGVAPLAAQEEEPVSDNEVVMLPASDETNPFDNLAVLLVIDVSGSMSYTDPLRLRETAAGMFIDLLGAEDYLGVIIFDDRAELVSPLAPAGTPADREALAEKLFPRLDPRGDTDFVEALALAETQFEQTDIGGRVPVILLLTDGEPDPYPSSREDEEFMAGYMQLLWQQVDLLADAGVLVYTVGFSEEIDPEVIRGIAVKTRGQYYILQEPAELLLAFYQALEALKDRRSFLSDTVELGSGGSFTLDLEVGEFTRQVNLVLVSAAAPGEADLQVKVNPPRGRPENIEQLLVGGRDNYLAVIIASPQEEHYGTWQVEVSGSGSVMALGNADLYLETRLVDPDPGAHYPLNEPMEITLEIITREKFAGAGFYTELQVTAPGEEAVSIPLAREGDTFKGIFEEVNRAGDYLLSWQVYRGEEAVYASGAIVAVRQLPALSTDFWVGAEGLRLGEEMVVSASLTTDGERLQQGPTLQIEDINLVMEYRDGARIEVPFYDSGDRAHGNSRAGDGIWSNRLLFDREGSARVLLTATGSYRGANFILKKNFGVAIAAPGQVLARLSPEELWARPGERLQLPFVFESQSPFTQTLRLTAEAENLTLLQDRVVVPPGTVSEVMVEAEIGSAVEPGSYYVTVYLEAEDGMALVQPDVLDFEVRALTAAEAFVRRFSGLGLAIGAVLAALLAFAIVLFGGGNLLYRYYLLPRLRLGGHLAFRPAVQNPGVGDAQDQIIDIGRPAKSAVTVAFGEGNQGADFVISDSDCEYEMVISNSWNDHMPRFLRGWRAFFSRPLTVETVVRCTPPGVVTFGGKVYSRRELHQDDEFESGGFVFSYRGKAEKGLQTGGRGVNILDGKM
jgi:Mg-chelatase subunit ChlD